jgi:hypothetical protein
MKRKFKFQVNTVTNPIALGVEIIHPETSSLCYNYWVFIVKFIFWEFGLFIYKEPEKLK